MRKWLMAAALLAAAVYVVQPPRAATPAAVSAAWPPSARGAIHVHSRRSDGSGTLDQIAADAARAGLDFVVVTDHGDGVREPEPPRYRSGVLCIDALEVATDGGHVIALGLPPTPYPLGGSAGDVLEDIARLGGVAIAAHPDSPKPDLRWGDWRLPVGGLEWLNADSEWRDEGVATLARILVTLPFAGGRALSLSLDRPDETLRRWDDLLRTRRVVAVAAADAHARLGADDRTAAGSASIRMPSYRSVFELMSVTLQPLMLTRDAKADAAAVVEAIRTGRVYSSVDAVAAPARLSFQGTAGSRVVSMGDVVEIPETLVLEVASNPPTGSRIVLVRDGARVAMSSEPQLRFEAPAEPAAYRVEIEVDAAPGTPPVPWIVSNPIYVGARAGASVAPPAAARPATVVPRYPGVEPSEWVVETSVRSKAELSQVQTARGPQMLLRWALGGTISESPFAAAVIPVGEALRAHTHLILTARASKPTRVSVQLRRPDGAGGERWRRSIYLDTDPREVTIPIAEMLPVPPGATPPPLDDVRDLLFVLDTVNSALGSNGQVWIERLAYGR